MSSRIATVKTVGSLPKTENDEREEQQKLDNDRYLNKVYEDLIEKLPNSKNLEYAIFNSLDEVLQFDIAFLSALHRFESSNVNDIVEMGNLTWIRTVKEKLSKVLFLHLILPAVGLAEYSDTILSNTINTLFPDTTRKPEKNKNRDDIEGLVKELLASQFKGKRTKED